MTDTVKISATISATDNSAGLGLEILLDGQQIFNLDFVDQPQEFIYELDEVDADHELCFVMKNKTAEHTKIDETGSIIKDACLIISNLSFDEIALGHILTEKAEYFHNFNGSGPETQDKFYGQIGCNGTVSLKFSTPVYLWLLENM
jgi:hypothetical protein